MNQQSIFITLFSLGFIVMLMGLIVVLTIVRQIRYRRQENDLLPPPLVVPIQPVRETGTYRRATSTSEFRRVIVREPSSSQIVLGIEPPDATIPSQTTGTPVSFIKPEADRKAS